MCTNKLEWETGKGELAVLLMMWSALEAYSNEALFCNYGEPQNYRQAMFGNSSVECYSFRSFFALHCPNENYLPQFYYSNLLQRL